MTRARGAPAAAAARRFPGQSTEDILHQCTLEARGSHARSRCLYDIRDGSEWAHCDHRDIVHDMDGLGDLDSSLYEADDEWTTWNE